MNQKTYVMQVLRKLKCSGSRKKEIKKELISDITSFMENGETMDQIIGHMGRPIELAKEFNDNFSEQEIKSAKRKKIGIILGIIAGVILLAGCAIYYVLPKISEVSNSSVYTEDELETRTKKIVELLDHDAYDTLLNDYSSQNLQKVVTAQQLKSAKEMAGIDGKISDEMIQVTMKQINQMGKKYAVVAASVSYDNKNIIYTLSFNPEYQLEGIYIK